jgi:8-oxo-dGTP pyrophosphatase MutT (NUDIX family)
MPRCSIGRMPALPFEEFVTAVAEALGCLPGVEAQLRMAPQPRGGWKPGFAPDQAKPAAALLLLFPVGGDAVILLTKRAPDLPNHASQVSLPGGAVDSGESIEDAALREAEEEVGLTRGDVRVIGRLTPLHIPVSGFVLHPVVGVASVRPPMRPEPGEVERIIEAPVGHLLDARRHHRVTQVRNGFEFEMPYFELDGEQVWGATAMVLAEFAAVMGVQVRPGAPPEPPWPSVVC